MSFNFTEADITRFRGLTALQKRDVIKRVFNDEIVNTEASARAADWLNAEGLCQHKKQKIKDALTSLGL